MEDPKPREEEVPTRETLGDEGIESYNAGEVGTHHENQRLTYLNLKRQHGAHLNAELDQAKALNAITNQLLQNGVNVTNLVNSNTAAVTNLVNNNSAIMAALADRQALLLTNLAHDSFWNPVSSGAGMNLTAGAVPANRAADVAAAGTATASEGVASSVAKSAGAETVLLAQALAEAIRSQQAATAAMTALLGMLPKAVQTPTPAAS